MRKIIAIALLIAAILSSYAQDVDTLSSRLDYQRWVFPQEKIHVTTDRTQYTAGDTIWLRVFVSDAATHCPVHASKFVYVELHSPVDSVMRRVKLCERNGAFSGFLPLESTMADGRYTLSAYTLFMQSLDEAYFFKQPIQISSAYSLSSEIRSKMEWENNTLHVTLDYVSRNTGEPLKYETMCYKAGNEPLHTKGLGKGTVRFSLKDKELEGGAVWVQFDKHERYIPFPAASNDFEVGIFPEGGYLVPGVENKVAFKALNVAGASVAIEGQVKDDSGQEVAQLKYVHDGMALASFVPKSGVHYVANVTDRTGQVKQVTFPDVNVSAAVLQAVTDNGRKYTLRAAGAVPADAHIVLLQRGVLVAACPAAETLELDDASFEPGVMQALLIDGQYNTLSERLCFVGGNISNTASVVAPASVSDRDRVHIDTQFNGAQLANGSYAVSVTDDFYSPCDTSTTIATNLLLQSELKGHIANPAYYFTHGDDGRKHLDVLLMTQGWKRYDIPQVARGVMAEASQPIEAKPVISGQVVSEWKKKPIENGMVNIIIPKIGYAEQAPTDENGRFSITLNELPDSVACVMQALNKKGGKERRLTIDPDPFPHIKSVVEAEALSSQDDYIAHERDRIATSGDWRHIMLDEVVVQRNKPKQSEDVFQMLSSQSYGYEQMAARGITSLEEVIRTFPGVWVSNGYVRSSRSRDMGNPQGRQMPIFLNGELVAGGDDSTGKKAKKIPLSMRAAVKLTGETYSENYFEDLEREGNLKVVEQRVSSFQDIKRVDYIAPGMAAVLGNEAAQLGAIFILTKEGRDLAKSYNDLSLHIYRPLGSQKPAEFYNLTYDKGQEANQDAGADLRPTLYWNPCVTVKDGKASFDFYASDNASTSYTVKIEGLTEAGEIIQATRKIDKR